MGEVASNGLNPVLQPSLSHLAPFSGSPEGGRVSWADVLSHKHAALAPKKCNIELGCWSWLFFFSLRLFRGKATELGCPKIVR